MEGFGLSLQGSGIQHLGSRGGSWWNCEIQGNEKGSQSDAQGHWEERRGEEAAHSTNSSDIPAPVTQC